jgi:hypothetical protein
MTPGFGRGSLSRESLIPRRIDLTGQRYGRLLVKSYDRYQGCKSYWHCICDCGNKISVLSNSLRTGNTQSCGCIRVEKTREKWAGKRGPTWQGGRIALNGSGYVLIHSPDHPDARKNGYVLEHRAVMSEILGRPLDPGENVHHKNGVRDDNRPENLELWVTSQPAGQRPEDLVEWAKEILRRYDTDDGPVSE